MPRSMVAALLAAVGVTMPTLAVLAFDHAVLIAIAVAAGAAAGSAAYLAFPSTQRAQRSIPTASGTAAQKKCLKRHGSSCRNYLA